MKKIALILLLSVISYIIADFNVPTAYAIDSGDPAAYTNNIIAGIKEKPENLVHFFRIDVQYFPGLGAEDNQHSVRYEKENAQDDCWKMTGSDYFSISGDFYMCFTQGTTQTVTTGSSTINIYVKKNASEKATMSNLRLVQENDYSPASMTNPGTTTPYYMARYIKAVQSDLRINFEDKQSALKYYFLDKENGVLFDKGGEPPLVKLPAVGKSSLMPLNREVLDFILFDVKGWKGATADDTNNFYFKIRDLEAVQDKYLRFLLKDNALQLKISQNGSGNIIYSYRDPSAGQDSPFNETDIGEIESSSSWKTNWWNFIVNRVFNAKTTAGSNTTCGTVTKYQDGSGIANPPYNVDEFPPQNCINVNAGGWIKQWLGNDWQFKQESPSDLLDDKNACGSATIWQIATGHFADVMRVSICNLMLLVHEFAKGFVEGAVNAFNKTVGFDKNY